MVKIVNQVVVTILFVFCLVGLGEGLQHHSCPHPKFVQKHLCTYCKTPEDALKFSRSRNQKFVKINTVLFGDPSFEKINDKFCQNTEGVEIYDCNLRKGKCDKKGKNCTTKHHTASGHLEFKNIKC